MSEEQVGNGGQRPVANVVGDGHAARIPARQETAAVDDRGAGSNGCEERRILTRIVLEIGVLNEDVLARRMLERALNRAPFTLIFGVGDNLDTGVLRPRPADLDQCTVL